MSPFLLNKLRDFLFISSLSPPCSCVLLPVGGQDDCHMMKLFVEKVVYILHNGLSKIPLIALVQTMISLLYFCPDTMNTE